MRFKVKKIDVSTQGHNVCMINSDEATNLQLRDSDRVILSKGSKNLYSVVDIANTHHFIKKGEIGVFNEICDYLSLKAGAYVDVSVAEKPSSISLIKQKLDGVKIADSDIYSLVSDTVSSKLSEVEIAHFLSACYSNGLSLKEIHSLVNSFITTGNIMKFDKFPLLNFKTVGSFSNALDFVVGSIISASKVGFVTLLEDSKVPGSSNSIYKSFGMKKVVNEDSIKNLAKNYFILVSKEAFNISPASTKIMRIEHPISALSDELIAVCLLSESKSVSASHAFIPIIYGNGRAIKSAGDAKRLRSVLRKISSKLRIRFDSIILDGNYPWESSYGPGLEMRDIISILQNSESNIALKNISIEISSSIFSFLGFKNSKSIVLESIKSGRALDKLRAVVKSYGGSNTLHTSDSELSYDFRSNKNGFMSYIDNRMLAKLAMICGAPDCLNSGLRLYKSRHDRVLSGEKILSLHSSNNISLENAKNFLKHNEVIQIT